jgi:hypothetical protein
LVLCSPGFFLPPSPAPHPLRPPAIDTLPFSQQAGIIQLKKRRRPRAPSKNGLSKKQTLDKFFGYI